MAFFLLCALSASRWLFPAISDPLGGPGQRAGIFLAGALIAASFGGRGVPPQIFLRLSLGGLFLFGIPELLSQFGSISEINQVAIAALIPTAIVLLVSTGHGSASNSHPFLSAAVAGMGGVVLLLPVTIPQDLRALLLILPYLLGAISVALASVWLSRMLPLTSVPAGMMIICLANGLFLLLDAALTHGSKRMTPSLMSLPGVGLTLLQLGLLLWLLGALEPRRLSARFILVPLITAAEGIAFIHDGLTGRNVAGVMLCAFGAAYLFFAASSEEAVSLSLR